MMYFQELENLKYSLYYKRMKDYEIKVFEKAIDTLDLWLATRASQAKKRINPLDFAEQNDLDWEISIELFDSAQQFKLLEVFFELWSEDGMECLIRTTSYDEIVRNKVLYNSFTDDYEEVNPHMISVWYKLLKTPLHKPDIGGILEKKEFSPTIFTADNVKKRPEAASFYERIINRNSRSFR